MLRTEHAVIKP